MSVDLTDVGPIENLSIPIPKGGGVVVLKGRNGAGKTLALGAVSALIGNGRAVSRDGSLGARVEGLGARMTVARRTSRSGEIEVAHLEGEDPSLLVDPGIKDPGAADAERIRALLRLAGAEVSQEDFYDLVDGKENLLRLCKPESLKESDVPAMAAAIKRDLESEARRAETTVKNLQARTEGIRAAITKLFEDSGFEDLSEYDVGAVSELREFHEEAVRAVATEEGRKDTAGALLRSAAESQGLLESMGDAGTEEAVAAASTRREAADVAHSTAVAGKTGAALRSVEAVRDQARSRESLSKRKALLAKISEAQSVLDAMEEAGTEESVAAAVQTVETTNEVLAAATAVLVRSEAEREAAREAHEAAGEAVNRRAALQRSIAEAKDVTEPTEASVAALRTRVDEASSQLGSGLVLEKAQGLRVDLASLEGDSVEAKKTAEAMREAARGTEGVVVRKLAAVCGDDWSIQEGRLLIQTARGKTQFCELSNGERWRRSLDVAVPAVGPGGLLVVRQEAWEGLDPDNRTEIAEAARSRELVILTAECTDGDIRVEEHSVSNDG